MIAVVNLITIVTVAVINRVVVGGVDFLSIAVSVHYCDHSHHSLQRFLS